MSTAEIVSLVASIASLALAVIAIWLSIAFFKMSSQLSQSTTAAAKEIGSSVRRLEDLFDRLYTDTFAMVRDTYSDFRRHMWPEESPAADELVKKVEKRANEKIDELKQNMSAQIAEVFQRQGVADGELQGIRADVKRLVNQAIAGSRQADIKAREETLRDAIMRMVRSRHRMGGKPLTALELVGTVDADHPLGVVKELSKMKLDGLILFPGDAVARDTPIMLPSRDDPDGRTEGA